MQEVGTKLTTAVDGPSLKEKMGPLSNRDFSRAGARRGSPSSRSTPRRDHDDYRGVTFLAEATRPADLIVVDQLIAETHLTRK